MEPSHDIPGGKQDRPARKGRNGQWSDIEAGQRKSVCGLPEAAPAGRGRQDRERVSPPHGRATALRHLAVQGLVLHGLRQVLDADAVGTGKVGDGAHPHPDALRNAGVGETRRWRAVFAGASTVAVTSAAAREARSTKCCADSTSICRSMLSSRGPQTRPLSRCNFCAVQRQSRCGSVP